MSTATGVPVGVIAVGTFSPPSKSWTVGDLTGAGVARAGGAGLHKGNATIMDVTREWLASGERVYISTWSNTGWPLIVRILPWLIENAAFACVAVREGSCKLRPQFVSAMHARFGTDSVRIAENHSEVVVCGDYVLLTSGCSVPSDFFEWFEVLEDAELAGVLRAWFEALPCAGAAPVPVQLGLDEILRGWNE